MKRTKLLDWDKASRRQMMAATLGGCAAMTNASLVSTIVNMTAVNSAMANQGDFGSDYKAMVCLFLFGGNDSYNMISPAEPDERVDYVEVRGGLASDPNVQGGLALDENPAMNITDSVSGKQYMLHPSMTGVRDLYNAGEATFVANIGSLVEPVTMEEFRQNSKMLPVGLYSHSDLQQHWMTSKPQSRSEVKGWLGRLGDCIIDAGTAQRNTSISMNMSLGNVNMLQTGGSVIPYVITDSGAQEVGWYGPTWTEAKIFTTMTDEYLNRSYSNLMEETFAQQNRTALNAAIEFNQATMQDSVKAMVDSSFTGDANGNLSSLERDLRQVARTIAASGAVDLGTGTTLGQSRQSFFVSHGGYDNHDELINNQAARLAEVDRAVSSFQAAMKSMNLDQDVVLFSASDFARTLTTNGLGSDHAWGGNMVVVGGGLNGGKLYGTYPESLRIGNPLDVEFDPNRPERSTRGRLLPTTAVDELACELAMWYGLENGSEMELVLPNIRRFPSAASGAPLGMFT
ncbi:MAG: DUF1501 domain-containing protein [Planctomycetota bacterium]